MVLSPRPRQLPLSQPCEATRLPRAFNACPLISNPDMTLSPPQCRNRGFRKPDHLPKAMCSLISQYTSTYYVLGPQNSMVGQTRGSSPLGTSLSSRNHGNPSLKER